MQKTHKNKIVTAAKNGLNEDFWKYGKILKIIYKLFMYKFTDRLIRSSLSNLYNLK